MSSISKGKENLCDTHSIILISTLFLLLGGVLPEKALAQIPTPASVIGHRVGADYKLARWAKIVEYFEKLGKASDRVNVRRVGVSTEGKPYLLAEISSPDTMRQLDKYRALQARLHDPRLIRDDVERGEVWTYLRFGSPVVSRATQHKRLIGDWWCYFTVARRGLAGAEHRDSPLASRSLLMVQR